MEIRPFHTETMIISCRLSVASLCRVFTVTVLLSVHVIINTFDHCNGYCLCKLNVEDPDKWKLPIYSIIGKNVFILTQYQGYSPALIFSFLPLVNFFCSDSSFLLCGCGSSNLNSITILQGT